MKKSLILNAAYTKTVPIFSVGETRRRTIEDKQATLNTQEEAEKSLAKCFGGCQDVPDCLELKDGNSELGKHLSRY